MATYSHNALDVTVSMTSANTPSPCVVTADYEDSGSEGWRAFNHLSYPRWATDQGYSVANPASVIFDLGEGNERVVNSYTLTNGGDASVKWTIYGSNNGSSWDTLDVQTTGIAFNEDEMKTFSFSNSTPYRYYKLTQTGYDSYGGFGEIEYIAEAEPNLYEETIEDGLDFTENIHTYLNGVGDFFEETIDDSLSINSLSDIGFVYTNALNESLGLADLGYGVGLPFSQSLLDGLFVYDELKHGWRVTAESSLILADSIQTLLGIIVDEWINFIDIQSNNWNGREIISENVTLFDIAMAAKIYADNLSDELNIADVSTYGLTITVLEYLGFAELANAMRTSAAAISDSINVVDNPALEFPLSVESILSVVDLSTVAVQFLNSAQSDLGLADVSSLIKRISDTVTDPIVFVDTITSHAHLYSLIYDTLALNVIVELDGEVWECYVLNTPKFHPSMYSGFDFNSFCVFENRAFGANDTGIYELTGETDAGSQIHTGVILSETNFNSPNQKRMRRGYLDISGTSPKMILETGEGQRQAYAIDEQGKMVASHELKSKSWKLSLADFETLNSIKLIPVILTK